jgi:NADH dehydrogenase FAD-containing subunit
VPSFLSSLSRKAHESLVALGGEVRTGAAVTECSEEGVTVANERIPARTILWAAGVMASPAAGWLNAAHTALDASSEAPAWRPEKAPVNTRRGIAVRPG